MAKQIRWTALQRKIAALVDEGKSFNEIVAEGYSLNSTSKVMNALKKGSRPQEGSGKSMAPIGKSKSKSSIVTSPLPGGEKIGGIDETKAKPDKEQKDKPQPEEALSQDEEVEEGVGEDEDDMDEQEESPTKKPKEQAEGIGVVDEPKRKGTKKDEQPKEEKGKYEVTVADEGIKCTLFLSLQTLALYKIAAAKQAQLAKDGDAKLTLGDFLDECAESFFKDRKLKLGLVEL